MPWFEHKDAYEFPRDPTHEEIVAKIAAIDYDTSKAMRNLHKAQGVCEKLGINMSELVDNSSQSRRYYR